jgi:hypothetical protein
LEEVAESSTTTTLETGAASGSAGISVPLSQQSRAFLIEPKVRFFRAWYIGPR